MKKPYKKPEIKEVKLLMEDTLLSSCRASSTSTRSGRVTRACSRCRTTYSVT